MRKHIHTWIRTGSRKYTMTAYYEIKCKCGDSKWIEDKDIIPEGPQTEEEFKKKYGVNSYYPKNFWKH